MALTKTPICDFGKKADQFQLKSIDNKMISLNDAKGENGGRGNELVYHVSPKEEEAQATIPRSSSAGPQRFLHQHE